MKAHPPRWAMNLIEWLTADGCHVDIAGDLLEEFNSVKEIRGVQTARFLYVWTVLKCFRPFILKEKFNFQTPKLLMLNNYWQVGRRFILKNKLYASISIFGLGIGLACSLVLLIYVTNEISYDRFHKNGDQIYRISVTDKSPEGESTSSIITAAIAPTLNEELPEVSEFVRFSYPIDGFFVHDDKRINARNVLYTDSTLFEMFSFKLKKGDLRTCLKSPYSILLTPKLAKSLFGDDEPIGKMVRLNGDLMLEVTGVIDEAPTNSQLQYSSLISFSTLVKEGYYLDWNGGWNYFSYVKLIDRTSLVELKEKVPGITAKYINDRLKELKSEWILDFTPLYDIHLGTTDSGDWPNRGNILIIYVFAAVALMTLFMAMVNFINLSIAQSINRIKEIRVRKSIGATREMVISQFIFESFLFITLALVIAGLLIGVFYNTINEFLGYQLDQIYLSNSSLIIGIGLIVILVSIGSGAYPAYYLSSESSLNSSSLTSPKGNSANRGKVDKLVVFQFFISILLIVCTWSVYNQLSFVHSKNLGYDKENILVLRLNSKQASKNLDILKLELAKIPEVIESGASSDLPGVGFTSNGYVPEGRELPIMLHVLDIDHSFLNTIGLNLTEGRNFLQDVAHDKSAILVNQAMVDMMGWENPIGKIIKRDGEYQVIGVVADFNYASLHEKIEPLVLTMAPWQDQYSYLSIRIKANDIPSVIEKVEKTWQLVNPMDPFEYSFLDQHFNDIYLKEKQQAKLLFVFSMLAIIIGGMGLIGIVSYTLKQKTKEIGVRKVLGATALSLVSGISKKYILSICLGSLFAIPLAYLLINNWLNNFHYRIVLNPMVSVFSVLIVQVIALIIINCQTMVEIKKNPVESLKYE